MAERTGCPVLSSLWSYVLELCLTCYIILSIEPTKSSNMIAQSWAALVHTNSVIHHLKNAEKTPKSEGRCKQKRRCQRLSAEFGDHWLNALPSA
jgi:hypothetical protein